MHKCKSGNHWWLNKADADKCCDPQWKRALVVGGFGESNPMICEGVPMGRRWVENKESRPKAVKDA